MLLSGKYLCKSAAFNTHNNKWIFFVTLPSCKAKDVPKSKICFIFPVFMFNYNNIFVSYLRFVRLFFIFYVYFYDKLTFYMAGFYIVGILGNGTGFIWLFNNLLRPRFDYCTGYY